MSTLYLFAWEGVCAAAMSRVCKVRKPESTDSNGGINKILLPSIRDEDVNTLSYVCYIMTERPKRRL